MFGAMDCPVAPHFTSIKQTKAFAHSTTTNASKVDKLILQTTHPPVTGDCKHTEREKNLVNRLETCRPFIPCRKTRRRDIILRFIPSQVVTYSKYIRFYPVNGLIQSCKGQGLEGHRDHWERKITKYLLPSIAL